jgi:UDP-glucose 4-epimerase
MRILIVGGAGYIGSHVNRYLLDRGHLTGVLDNLSSGREVNIFRDSEFYKVDILDTARLHEVMDRGWDAVIHLAGFKAAGESMLKPEKYSVNNLGGTINILNCVAETGIKYLVFSSSAAVYGEPKRLPIDEDHPQNPENYYGFTKLEIERILAWYDKLKGIKFAALRYFNAAGYDPDGKVFGLEKNPANVFGEDYPTRDGTGVRDYIHVTDLADGHLRALEHITARNESLTVNLGSEAGISVKEMIDTAREVTGRSIPVDVVGRRPGDPAELYASSRRAFEVLGWKARFSDVKTLISTTWTVYRKLAAKP